MTADGPLLNKFKVTRRDGQHRKGKKHSQCQYFVLDLTHDPYAISALKEYIAHCAKTHPELARDIFERFIKDRT